MVDFYETVDPLKFVDIDLQLSTSAEKMTAFEGLNFLPQVTNISAGNDLAKRRFFEGSCLDSNAKDSNSSKNCPWISLKNIQLQRTTKQPFNSSLIFVIQDQRVPDLTK